MGWILTRKERSKSCGRIGCWSSINLALRHVLSGIPLFCPFYGLHGNLNTDKVVNIQVVVRKVSFKYRIIWQKFSSL
jgi:hypothetical protein